jgi:hypothetical protein
VQARLEPTKVEHLIVLHYNGKLLAIPINIRLEWKWIAVVNTVAYCDTATITVVKSFIVQAPGAEWRLDSNPRSQDEWSRALPLCYRQGTLRGIYHCTIDLLFDWFGLVCFANKNKNCQLSYSWYQTSQTGGQQYSDTSPFSIPCFRCWLLLIILRCFVPKLGSTSLKQFQWRNSGLNLLPFYELYCFITLNNFSKWTETV